MFVYTCRICGRKITSDHHGSPNYCGGKLKDSCKGWKDKEEKIKEQEKNIPKDEDYEPWIYE